MQIYEWMPCLGSNGRGRDYFLVAQILK
jgi:hypothetical protein